MRTALVLTAALAAAVSLAACHKHGHAGSNATADGSSAAGPSSSGGGTTLSASDMPHPRPGLWKMHMVNADMPRPIDYSQCIGPETNKDVDWTGKGADHHCNPSVTRGLDGSIHGTATCAMERGMSMAMDFRVAGDFNNHYTVHVDNTMSGAPMASLNGKHSMDIDAVWSGPCAPGAHGMQTGQ